MRGWMDSWEGRKGRPFVSWNQRGEKKKKRCSYIVFCRKASGLILRILPASEWNWVVTFFSLSFFFSLSVPSLTICIIVCDISRCRVNYGRFWERIINGRSRIEKEPNFFLGQAESAKKCRLFIYFSRPFFCICQCVTERSILSLLIGALAASERL